MLTGLLKPGGCSNYLDPRLRGDDVKWQATELAQTLESPHWIPACAGMT